MKCEEVYQMAERYLSAPGQRLVEELLSDDMQMQAEAVVIGAMLAKGVSLDQDSIECMDDALTNYGESFKDLADPTR
jgi:hypothetical protein